MTGTTAPVTVRVIGPEVVVKASQKRLALIEACKARGYRWDSSTASWRLPVSAELGSAEECAAEIANALMSAGISVSANDAILSKTKDYPVYSRWVSPGAGEMAGWLLVAITDDVDDARKAAILVDIIGKRSSRNVWYVRPENWPDLLEIATRYDLHITPRADAMLRAARDKEVAGGRPRCVSAIQRILRLG